MILSNDEIHKALDARRIVIDPEPGPRTSHGPEECPYGNHSVDLRLGPVISVPGPGSFAYDFIGPSGIAEEIAKHCKDYKLTDEQPFTLKPDQFILSRTLEWIELPLGDNPNLAARIEGKSSRARCGLLVHFTAPTVHPGFRGFLTLEIINLGRTPIILRPEMYIAQLIVEQVFGNILDNPSQFQNQQTPEGLGS